MDQRGGLRTIGMGILLAAAFAGAFLAAQAFLAPAPDTSLDGDSSAGRGAATSDDEANPLPIAITGRNATTTAFQRRIVAGDKFRDLLALVRSTPDEQNTPHAKRAAINELLTLRQDLLSIEEDSARRVRSDGIERVLEEVVGRALDSGSLQLQTKEPSDALGNGQLVRVWALSDPIPRDAVVRATEFIATLDTLAHVDSTPGFDVFTARNLARAIWRENAFPDWAGGVYLHVDELALVDTNSRTGYIERTLIHELAHAWERAHRPKWRRRFLSEGLAEFLEFAEVDAGTLIVDVRKLRHNFAELLRRFGQWHLVNGKPRAPQLAELVDCDPRTFYGLRRLSYPLSQAMFAFLGVDIVLKAIQRDDEDGLAQALRSISWDDLYAFIQKHGEDGYHRSARWVNEPTLDPYVAGGVTWRERQQMYLRIGMPWSERRDAKKRQAPAQNPADLTDQEARFRIGAKIRDVATLSDLSNPSHLERLGTLIRDTAHTGSLQVASEASIAMAQRMRYRDPPVALPAPSSRDITTRPLRTAVVGGMLSTLQAIAPTVPISTHRLAAGAKAGSLPYAKEHVVPTLNGQVAGLLLPGTGRAYVVFLTSSDRSTVQRLYAQLEKSDPVWTRATPEQRLRGAALLLSTTLKGLRAPPAGVLYLDLSEGKSDAALMALALSVAWKDAVIGYWDPSRE